MLDNSDICARPDNSQKPVKPGNYKQSRNFWKNMKTKNFELIELPIGVNQGVGRVMFSDIPQLRNTALRALETWNVSNVGKSPNGLAVITAENAANVYIGLFINGKDTIVRMPLVSLNRMYVNPSAYGAATAHLQEFEDLQGVDWSKSYVQFAAAPAATAFAIIIGVYYT
jgi:hypothetical protein